MTGSPTSAEWLAVLDSPRRPARQVLRRDIPIEPGVYAWFHDGACVYLGKASSLRARLATHLSTSRDLSRSTLRSWVAVRELGLERASTRERPSRMSTEQVDVVNAWLRECELTWLATDTRDAASDLEARLLSAWRPPINVA